MSKKPPGTENVSAGDWLYMEWLENGTMLRFIKKVKESNTKLPNRLLWRFSMCRESPAPIFSPKFSENDTAQTKTEEQRRI